MKRLRVWRKILHHNLNASQLSTRNSKPSTHIAGFSLLDFVATHLGLVFKTVCHLLFATRHSPLTIRYSLLFRPADLPTSRFADNFGLA